MVGFGGPKTSPIVKAFSIKRVTGVAHNYTCIIQPYRVSEVLLRILLLKTLPHVNEAYNSNPPLTLNLLASTLYIPSCFHDLTFSVNSSVSLKQLPLQPGRNVFAPFAVPKSSNLGRVPQPTDRSKENKTEVPLC